MSVYDAVTERVKELPPNTLSHGSIVSFPDRGPWGNSRYRGNCSGHVYKRIFEHLRPRVFTDPMVGSGTSVEVAREMGIEAYGLDLHSGFNILKTSILETVGKPSDLVLSHPPYHDLIPYSGSEWGRGGGPHPDDLSRCATEDQHGQAVHRTPEPANRYRDRRPLRPHHRRRAARRTDATSRPRRKLSHGCRGTNSDQSSSRRSTMWQAILSAMPR